MFSPTSVAQAAGPARSMLPIMIVLIPAAGAIAYSYATRHRSSPGGTLFRYRNGSTDWIGASLALVLILAGVLYFLFQKEAFMSVIPLTPADTLTASPYSMIPLLLVMLPFVGALACGLIGRYSAELRDCIAASVTFTVFALAVSLYPLVVQGPVVFELPFFIGLGLFFRIDFFGFIFATLSSLVWFFATLYSSEYMHHEQAPTRYFVFLLLSLGGCLGVFITADFFSLFLFFEAMTLFSYALVVHNHSEEAMAAGRNYLYMGIFGGLCLLGALLLLYTGTGTLAIAPNLEAFATLGTTRYLIALLFFIGFGIKAGAAPLHIWLPQAHPVAPTPASALLSGIMIKTGAYGIIRVFNVLFTPHDGHSPLWNMTGEFGFLVIWVGMVTMLTAAVLALTQTHAKRVLAYSSVSQMGYILMGIGAAAYLGYEGAVGFAGLTYHILNHAFFKAGMFLMVGAVYLRTHDLNYSKLGGLWRNFPVTAASFLVAGAAISGIPGFNGYASKTLLHHAIVEAVAHHGSTSLMVAEKIFVITGGLTFCYIIRLFSSIFLGRKSDTAGHGYSKETWVEKGIFSAFASVIILGGVLPGKVVERVIIPMSAGFMYDHHGLDHLHELNFWGIHDLEGIGVSLGIGLVAFVILSRMDFAIPLPKQLSVEKLLYRPVLVGFNFVFTKIGRAVETVVEGGLVGSVGPFCSIAGVIGAVEGKVLPWSGHLIRNVALGTRDGVYAYVIRHIEMVADYTRQVELAAFFTMVKVDYNARGDNLYKKLTLMNLDLCIFIVVVTLVIVFSLRFLTLMTP